MDFKRKLKPYGSIEKSKALDGCLCFDAFAPMTRISTIRVLITLASVHNLLIH